MMLFSEKMEPFYQAISTFPTVFFSILLTFCVLFWLIAVVGLIEIDVLDLPDVSGEADSAWGNPAAALFMKLGLHGVPLMIVLTFIALIGWAISYNAMYFLKTYLVFGAMNGLIKAGIFILSLYGSIALTAQVIKPIRKLFVAMSEQNEKIILGQVSVVRTSRVDNKFGEATLNDGGAGLIIKVRSTNDETFHQGDRVVPYEYNEEDNVYYVVSEAEFSNTNL